MPFATLALPFDPYRELPSPAHRWLLACLARYADRAGRCFPNLRQLAADARMSLSTVSRRMAELDRLECFTRERKPGGRYRYELAEPYRLRWPGPDRAVSRQDRAVSQSARQKAKPGKQVETAPPDDRQKWEPRLRGWRRSRFWLPFWGPKPSESGCWAPAELLAS